MVISIVLIFILSSVIFVSSSIKHTINSSLNNQPDFVITPVQDGINQTLDIDMVEQISSIRGVVKVNARVYGRYYFRIKGKSFLIVGVDFFDEQNSKLLQKLIGDNSLDEFFKQDNMIVSSEVAKFLKQHFFDNSYTFKLPDGKFKSVHIYKTIPRNTNLIANDMIVMPIELAQKILALKEDEVTQISFDVPNDAEWQNIENKLYLKFYNINVTNKKEIKSYYDDMFNYKGGLFMVLYLVSIVTFMMILYQRYSSVNTNDSKDIGILRAIGWSIKDVLKLKFFESFWVVMSSFIIGVVAAYVYVFMFDAPLLIDIFIGMDNLPLDIELTPYIDMGMLVSLWLLFVVPYISATIIPSWKIATTSATEAMK
jgi:ABC-type lipoprotein release transport system permease subunit